MPPPPTRDPTPSRFAPLAIITLVLLAAVVALTLDVAEDRLRASADRLDEFADTTTRLRHQASGMLDYLHDISTRQRMWLALNREATTAADALRDTDDSELTEALGRAWADTTQALGDFDQSLASFIDRHPEIARSRVPLQSLADETAQDPRFGDETRAGARRIIEDGGKLTHSLHALTLALEQRRAQLGARIAPFDIYGRIAIGAIFLGVAIATALLLRRMTLLHRAVLIDNQARVEAERRIRVGEEELHILLHSLVDAVITTDTTMRIQRMNPAAEQLTGWRAAEATGRPSSEVLGFVDHSTGFRLPGPIADALRLGTAAACPPNTEITRRDGQPRRVAGNAAPILDEQSTVRGSVLVMQDITVRHALESRLRKSQKMESIGQLAGGIAHDFNNLLQIILGNARLLQPRVAASPDDAASLAEIEVAGQRAAELTGQLLAFGRRQTLELARTDLVALTTRSIQLLRRVTPAHIELLFHEPPQPVFARIDPTQIEQALINLVLNARDAISGNGRITIAIDEIEIGAGRPLDGKPLRSGPFARLHIADTGCGMNEELRRHIFEPFFSMKDFGGGSGLGLAVVHGIVEQHGGFIELESTPGRGTTFIIHLPIDTRPSPADAVETKISPAHPHRSPARNAGTTILLAEDEAPVRKLAARILTSAGYDLLLAADGEEACQLIDEHDGTIALILTDVMMPKADGMVVAQHARARHAHVPVIFTTGYTDGAIGEEPVAPPWFLLRKPYAVNDLIEMVAHAFSTETPRPGN